MSPKRHDHQMARDVIIRKLIPTLERAFGLKRPEAIQLLAGLSPELRAFLWSLKSKAQTLKNSRPKIWKMGVQ